MTTYALEVKELPGQNPAAAPPPSNPVHNTEAPAWSGDVYQEGDESSPEQSQWSFTGDGGEEAWLDRSQDGSITGWVRDPDGTVYRYTDPDAWAVDVDDAGMAPQGAAPEGEPVEGEDPNAVDDPTQGDDYSDEPEVDEDAAYDEYANGDGEEDPEADPDADVEGDEPTDDETDEPEEDGEDPDAEGDDTLDGDEDEDDESGPPFKKKKPGFEAKVYRLPYA